MNGRSRFDTGWNDMAYAINTYTHGSTNELIAEYVRRCRAIASNGKAYHRGCRKACDLFLEGKVEKLDYRGGWIPQS